MITVSKDLRAEKEKEGGMGWVFYVFAWVARFWLNDCVWFIA